MTVDGFRPDTYPLVSDASGGTNTVLTSHQSQMSVWAQPWTFTNSVMLDNGGSGPTIEDSSANQFSQQMYSGTTLQWNYTPSGTSTAEILFNIFSASATDKRLQLLGTTNNELVSPYGQLRVLTQTGQALWLGDDNSQLYILNGTIYSPQSGGAASLKMTNTGILQWSATTGAGGGTDTGITRNAAGVLEVDNGTAGDLATLIAKNIGIGTTSPYARLSVWGPDAASSTLAFNVVSSASTTVFAVFDGGNAQLSGTLTQSSDQRLKTNVQTLDASSSLSLINALNPVTFNWIDPNQGTGAQLGFIAQQVRQVFPNLVSTTSATALTPGGTLGLNYIGLISPIVSAIQALYADIQSLEQTVAGFAESFTSETITATNQLCVNESDGTPVCITGDQLAAVLSAASASQTTESVTSSADSNSSSTFSESVSSDTPPIIQINGDNPAIVQVGDTYNDLGATITGPQADLDLGITTYVNGVKASPVQIDTGTVATDTIDYVATDQNGLTSTSTRTVIIEAIANTATSTVQ